MSALKTVSKTLEKIMSNSGKKMSAKSPAPPLEKGAYDIIKTQGDVFSIGFSKAAVMPRDVLKKKYYVAGYSAYNPAVEVLDPMTVSAVWLDDKTGRGGVVFVSVDSVGLTDYDVNIIREKLRDFKAKTGCRAINVLSTHNHAGIDTVGMWGPLPKSGRDEKYMELLHNRAAQVVRQAYDDSRDGKLYYGKKESEEIQRDSRLPHVFCKDLTRLRFVPDDGSREVWILNYASHTESMLGKPIVSADFACYLRREIIEKAGAESIYFVGAIGGLIRLKELDEDPIKSTIIGGHSLAKTAMSIENEVKLEANISMLRQEYYAPADNFVLAAATALGIIKKQRFGTGATNGTGLSIKTEMTYISIGSLNMLLLPSEIFPELCYGGYLSADESATGSSPEINPTPLVEIAGDKNLLVFGVANDFTGYVVPPNDFMLNPDSPYVKEAYDRLGRKHYEETNSLGPKTAQTIADTFAQIIATVKENEVKA